jgi:hypothetical protein
LILVAIGLIFTPLRLGKDLVLVFLPLFADKERWEALTSPDGTLYHPLMKPLLIGEAIGNTTTALFALVLLVFFFSKKRIFPRLAILYLVGNTLVVVLDFIVAAQIPLLARADNPAPLLEIGRGILSCCIWIPYMLVSKRVKATFTK